MNMIMYTFDRSENTGVLTTNDSTAVMAAVKDASKCIEQFASKHFLF